MLTIVNVPKKLQQNSHIIELTSLTQQRSFQGLVASLGVVIVCRFVFCKHVLNPPTTRFNEASLSKFICVVCHACLFSS